jgi:GcrA cell cycle regulator
MLEGTDMNERINPLSLDGKFIGPPIEADRAELGVPVRKPARRKPVTTIALTSDTCRWPFGDPTEPDFHYCGERPLIGQPYCETHDAQSYQGGGKKRPPAIRRPPE